MSKWLLLCALLAAGACLAQAKPALLHGCNSLDGVSVGQAAGSPDTKLEISSDKAYVSEGEGCLHLRSKSPQGAKGNSYLSVIFTTPPVDMRGKALVLEAATSLPQQTQAFYVRGYNAAGQPVLSWLNWSGPLKAERQTIELAPGISDLLAWEPGYLKSDDRSAVVRWEFYVGTRDAGADFDLYLDNLRTVPSTTRSFNDVAAAHKLYPQTSLAAAGKPEAMIVAPVDPAWAAVAAEVAAAVKKAAGVDLPVKSAAEVTNAQMAETNTILLGNIAANRAMLYPYSHMMMFADGVFPGAGGYELRCVSDPWGSGRNLLILGATDVAGGRAAAAAFAKLLQPGPDLALPRLCEVKLGSGAESRWGSIFTQKLDEAWVKGQQKTAEDGLLNGVHTGLFGQIAGVGQNYAVSGRPEYAKMFVWLARRANEHYLTKPDTFGGPWGMDSDFTAYQVIPAWDAVEECPELSDADRLAVSKILFQWITDAALPEGTGAASGAAAGGMVSNHGTFAALGTFCAGEYFSKYYDAVEAKRWVKIGDNCFKNLATSTKAHEDCNGYQWLTNLHNIRYALMKPDLTIFENGSVRRMADYAALTMNNLGYQVPYGDTGAWICWFSELPVLRAAEWFYRDGRYQWVVNKKVDITGRQALGDYDCGGAGKSPDDLLGSRAWALEPRYYRGDKGPEKLPERAAFDKMAFRDGFDPKSAYLLLDGLSNGGHRHMDGNSILQWTENERVWLADADYIKSLPKYHNTVLILKDGQSAAIPDFVELEHAADLPSFAASTTTYRNYAGVDWQRNVVWLKGRMFVVVDRLTAREAGDYSFRGIWQTVGEVSLQGSALDIDQKGQYARFATTADERCLVSDDPATGKNWSSYPYLKKPVVRVLQTVLNRKLKAGESVCMFTVLHASGEKPSQARVVRLNDTSAAVTGAGEPVVVGVPDAAGTVKLSDELTASAAAVVFTPQAGFALGLTKASFLGQQQAYPGGADLEFGIEKGEAVIKAPAGIAAEMPQKMSRVSAAAGLPAGEIRGFIDMAIKAAPPAAAPAAGLAQCTPLVRKWSYADKLESYLLTNNADAFEAVEAGLKLSCRPEPLAQNVFATDKTNTLDNLTDGALLTSDGGVMWADDQQVTVDLSLDNNYDLDRLGLRCWFASASSKNKLFQLGRLQAIASNDGFKQDLRTLVDATDKEQHGNWGAPSYGPHLYEFAGLKAKARALRLILTPRPGTAIYLSEVQLWGTRPGLEIDLATKLARGVPVHLFSAVKAADLDGDKIAEIIAGSSNGSLYCFDSSGRVRWRLDCGAPVNCVNTVDFNGDGRPAVLAGCMDAKLVAADAAGKQLWVFQPPYYKRAGHIRTVFPADLQGTGKQTAIAGAENWHYYAVDAAGKQVWQYESVHGSTAGCAADLDGDKKQEVIAGTEYYWWHAINPDGKQRWGYHAGPCANAAAAGDLDGDGKREAVFGSADGCVHVVAPDGTLRFSFNTGDEVSAVECADVNADGKEELLVSSLSFNVYCLDGSGKVLWRNDLGRTVRALAICRGGEGLQVAAGCDDGTVAVFNARDGRPLHQYDSGSAVLSLAAGDCGGTAQSLIAGTADGNLSLLTLPAK